MTKKTLVLFDHQEYWSGLLPLTFTRPVGALRVGIDTLAEKWSHFSGLEIKYLTNPYLCDLYAGHKAEEGALYVNGAAMANAELWRAIEDLPVHHQLWQGEHLLAWHTSQRLGPEQLQKPLASWKPEEDYFCLQYTGELKILCNPTDIFAYNGAQIREDFRRLTAGRTSAALTDPYTQVYSAENLFLEEGADVKAAIINAADGPVYIGRGAQVQEGAIIKGPLAVLEGGVINMGAKMRGDTTVGPYCKVGGEVSNVVFQAYSNKGHDGFLGNSVLGAWCNLGADTNSSNLKNNYKNVSIHSYRTGKAEDTGKLFCGLIMGDHSKAGINTMFNTGTVVGVGCNIYGGGFPAKHIPSFTWGGLQDGYGHYRIHKLLETEAVVMARRKIELTEAYARMLHHLHEHLKMQDGPTPTFM